MKPPRQSSLPVLELARALYATKEGGAGCCLHITLDDGNIGDSSIAYCLNNARERGHERCITLAEALLTLSKTQRLKIYNARK